MDSDGPDFRQAGIVENGALTFACNVIHQPVRLGSGIELPVHGDGERSYVRLPRFVINLRLAPGVDPIDAAPISGPDIKRPVRSRLQAPDVLRGGVPNLFGFAALETE